MSAITTAIGHRAGLPLEMTGIPDILLVEDDPDIRALTRDLLDDLGYRVRATGHPEEALGLLTGPLRPKVLISDFSLPGMDGTELIQAAWAHHPLLPAILVTGYALCPGDLPHPSVPLLYKPFRLEDLEAALVTAFAANG